MKEKFFKMNKNRVEYKVNNKYYFEISCTYEDSKTERILCTVVIKKVIFYTFIVNFVAKIKYTYIDKDSNVMEEQDDLKFGLFPEEPINIYLLTPVSNVFKFIDDEVAPQLIDVLFGEFKKTCSGNFKVDKFVKHDT